MRHSMTLSWIKFLVISLLQSQVNRDGASTRGSDASVAQCSLRRQRRIQMRSWHASAGWTALYHVVQGRPATSRDRKAIGITEAQRNRKGGPRHVSVHCEKVGRRHGSSIGGTSTRRYVNTFFGICFPVTNHKNHWRKLRELESDIYTMC